MLIGREAELQRLNSALTECAADKARTIVIEGPAGCGKSELLEAVMANAAAQGAMVLRAAALRSESDLPLGVMRQLVDSPELSAGAGARLRALLDEDATTADPRHPDHVPPARAAGMQRICAALHEVVRARVVLVGVDDLQHVDPQSLQYLLYIAGRSRSTRLLMVFTEALYYRQRASAYRTEFLRQPNFQRIRLNGLDREDVAAFLAPQPVNGASHPVDGAPRPANGVPYPTRGPDRSWAAELYAVTGGNPLLLRALQEDRLLSTAADAAVEPPEEPSAGEAFAHAVLTCLVRSGPAAAAVAEGLAVLGESGTPDLLADVCELPRVAAVQGLRALRAAGVVEGTRFRHPATRAAVLDGMDPDHRRRLHHRSATQLYGDGAAPAAIAPHLRAAEFLDAPWAVPVLRDAAEEVLADDDVRSAVAYLDLAHRLSAEERQRTEIRIRTAVILRRTNPAAAESVADGLLRGLRSGRLTVQHHGAAVAELLIGHRRVDDATEIFGLLRDPAGGADPVPGAQMSSPTVVRIAESYYPWAAWRMLGGEQGPEPAALTPLPSEENQYTGLPWSVPVPVPSHRDDVAAAAEETLHRSVLTDLTLEPICSAVKCLLYQGRTDRSLYWSELFMKEADRRDTAGWYAMFAGLRAEVAMHQGDLREVEELTHAALRRLPERKGSVLARGLVAVQVLAQTAMGNYEAAARTLNQPASAALFRSAYGLAHLRSRGHYHLATNRLDAAMEDFLTAGRMAQGWGFDQPSWVPWRGDVVEVLLRLGEREEAERLAMEQLSRCEGGSARIRGITLRQLAAATRPRERLAPLSRAVAQLQIAGDRLELAHALYDLGEAHRGMGDTAQAMMAARRAWHLAKECGAEPLCARLRLEYDGADWDFVPEEGITESREVRLSDSEKRVAALAACGYTNRDISSRLYITVSTVEQHLTRVYRKLKIDGRQQLPAGLQFEVSEIA